MGLRRVAGTTDLGVFVVIGIFRSPLVGALEVRTRRMESQSADACFGSSGLQVGQGPAASLERIFLRLQK